MSKKCKGCGAPLQYTEKNNVGYAPKEDALYCQRCFRITHYDDVMISLQKGIDSDEVLSKVAKMNALVLWVVDIFDFEANIIKGMNRHLLGKDIVLVVTKRDLLPRTLGNDKIGKFVLARLKEKGIEVKGVVICTDLVKHAHHEDNYSIEELKKAIRLYRGNRDVVVIGMANAGKSTLLNAFLKRQQLTVSNHPGTTVDFNAMSVGDYKIYDTPGLTRYDSLLTHIDDKKLKQIIPTKEINPVKFQLTKDQCLSLSGLVRLDLKNCEKVTCVCYFAPGLNIHRSKLERADELWNEHLGKDLLSITLDTNYKHMKVYESKMIANKMDVVIHGLGFFCLSGDVDQVRVLVNKEIDVTFRGAII